MSEHSTSSTDVNSSPASPSSNIQSLSLADPPGREPSYVIQKFGGTSLGKYSLSIINNVIKFVNSRIIWRPYEY